MTLFSEDEIDGFDEVIGTTARDFVTVSPHHDFRFARFGQYPVLRGSLINLTDNQCLLFTS
jgi:hypothetical protein